MFFLFCDISKVEMLFRLQITTEQSVYLNSLAVLILQAESHGKRYRCMIWLWRKHAQKMFHWWYHIVRRIRISRKIEREDCCWVGAVWRACTNSSTPFSRSVIMMSSELLQCTSPVCACVCVLFPFVLDIKFVGRTSRAHTGGMSHRIFHPPSFCGAYLNFSREKDSAIPFPRRPWSGILCTNNFIVLHFLLGIFIFIFSEKNLAYRDRNHVPTCQKVTRLPLSYRGDRPDIDNLLLYDKI